MRPFFYGGDEEDRTPDPLRARQMLSQLSYTPVFLQHLQNQTMQVTALADQSLEIF